MDFAKASRQDINNLIEKYNKIKRTTGYDLKTRENNVKYLVKQQEIKKDLMSKLIVVNYLIDEILPTIDNFDEPDRETLRQYFRYISKQKTLAFGIFNLGNTKLFSKT